MQLSKQLTRVSGSGPVRRLEIKISISAPIKAVWEALTDSNKVQHWWTAGLIEPKEGGRFVLGDGSEVNGTVKLCFPPYLFEFSWNDSPQQAAHPHLIDPSTKSTVRFDLTELATDQTSLTFVQYLPPGELVAASAGWHQIVGERLVSYLETGEVADDPDRFSKLKMLYEDAEIQ